MKEYSFLSCKYLTIDAVVVIVEVAATKVNYIFGSSFPLENV